jgi:hypothetical protein
MVAASMLAQSAFGNLVNAGFGVPSMRALFMRFAIAAFF